MENDLMSRLYLPENERRYEFDKMTKKRCVERSLQVIDVDNGIVLPVQGDAGGVCNENFEFVAGLLTLEEELRTPNYSPRWIYKSYRVDANNIKKLDETVVFGGVMLNHPGHLILECLGSRLWWHIKNPDSKLRFVFVSAWPSDKNFAEEFLELLGLPKERILFIDQPVQFKKIIVPEQAMYHEPNGHFTKEYMSVINLIKDHVEPASYDKIYLTRRKVKKLDTINEEYFINFFESKGYKIIDPEDFSIKEKISFFKGAKEIAGTGGTNALYAVFSNPDVQLIILGRANDPIAEQYFPYEAADIKNCYVIDVSLSFLHRDRVWGVCLIGPTNYWKKFVQDHYNETILESEEDTLKRYSYDYLKRCAEYYSSPGLFNFFKNFDHFNIINLLNERFLGRKLERGQYGKNNIEQLYKWEQNSRVFFEKMSYDLIENKMFVRSILAMKDKKISILSGATFVGKFMTKYAELNEVEVVFSSEKWQLSELSDAEFDRCRQADYIINCNIHGIVAEERQGMNTIMVNNLFIDGCIGATSDGKQLIVPELADTVIKAMDEAKKEFAKCNAMLSTQLSDYRIDKERFEALREEIKDLRNEKNKLNEELIHVSFEKDAITQGLDKAKEDVGLLSQERSSLYKTIGQMESMIERYETDIQSLLQKNDGLEAELKKSQKDLQADIEHIRTLEAECESLKAQISEMENSRSWRYTKIFRKNKKEVEE